MTSQLEYRDLLKSKKRDKRFDKQEKQEAAVKKIVAPKKKAVKKKAK